MPTHCELPYKITGRWLTPSPNELHWGIKLMLAPIQNIIFFYQFLGFLIVKPIIEFFSIEPKASA